jgi:hypothetical protein
VPGTNFEAAASKDESQGNHRAVSSVKDFIYVAQESPPHQLASSHTHPIKKCPTIKPSQTFTISSIRTIIHTHPLTSVVILIITVRALDEFHPMFATELFCRF